MIEIKNVSRTYSDGQHTEALRDVSLEIRRGEFLSLTGPSGCGKTSLLRLIAGLDSPQDGELLMEGRAIDSPCHERGYVFQQAALFPWKTVEENIAFGLRARRVYREKKRLVGEYLSLVGLDGFSKSYPHELSGGMVQRAAIARALINGPKVLLLDEPLGALDAFTRIELQNVIREIWRKTATTVVLVTHDVDEAIYLSDRIAVMTPRPGRISEILTVNLPAGRDRDSEDFIGLRRTMLRKLTINN
ncbi:MAG: ABC transporter ATP-binding protein [Prevotellaceae bacterium]|nr:ABC transporter ATP-binding protein [Prevotellaceae bacterium]